MCIQLRIPGRAAANKMRTECKRTDRKRAQHGREGREIERNKRQPANGSTIVCRSSVKCAVSEAPTFAFTPTTAPAGAHRQMTPPKSRSKINNRRENRAAARKRNQINAKCSGINFWTCLSFLNAFIFDFRRRRLKCEPKSAINGCDTWTELTSAESRQFHFQ